MALEDESTQFTEGDTICCSRGCQSLITLVGGADESDVRMPQ